MQPEPDGLARLVIAIDGPAGSGKSSTSRGVAQRLGLRYLDTGAMYRAMTWHLLTRSVSLDDVDAVAARAAEAKIVSGTDASVPTITLGGVDVSVEIRSDATTAAVSQVSAVPRVRQLLKEMQRSIIGPGGIVVEGRDIGTVVAPDAGLKIYLVADPAARAERRAAELTDQHERDVALVEAALLRRDVLDSTRAASPLAAASDAVVLDTTYLTLGEVIGAIVELARQQADR
ncbi:MAG: (d)CMP kinase [Nocardioidaceae bacterium]|nr:(d)CMP kinase [Nocardioidaceae bacterium]